MQMSDESELVLMDHNRVERALKRMAYQIAEDNRADRELCLIGIKDRGTIAAGMLETYLSEIYDRELSVRRIDPGQPDSDLFAEVSVSDTYPLVIDDVIFSGKTMFTTLNVIYRMAPFSELHNAVLVDRGHRKYPVQAQFTGLAYSTKLKEHVSVVIENETIRKVVVGIS